MNLFEILVIVASIGSVAAYVMKKKQELMVISKLPAEEARAYYEAVLRRERRTRLIAIAAMVALVVAVVGSAALGR